MRRVLLADAELFDAHLHLGHDIDGMVGDYEAARRADGCLRHFPRVHASASTSRTQASLLQRRERGQRSAFAGRSEGPVDPVPPARPERMAPRRGEAGGGCRRARDQAPSARAQSFTANDRHSAPDLRARGRAPGADPRHPRRARVASRSRTACARSSTDYPGATADHRARRHHQPGRSPRRSWPGGRACFSDTSTWSPVSLLGFYGLIPPEQVTSTRASYQYGQQPGSLLIALPHRAGWPATRTAQLRAMLAGTANAVADGHELAEPTSPLSGGGFTQPLQLARMNQYLSMTTPLLSAAPAGHERGARAGMEQRAPSGTATSSPSTASTSCSSHRATSGRRCLQSRERAPRRFEERASRSASSILADIRGGDGQCLSCA